MAAKRTHGRHSQGCDLRIVRGGQTGSTETSRPDRARPLLRAEVPRVPVADDLESLERVHLGKCICVYDLLCRVQPLVSNTRQLSGVQPNPPLELESVKRLDH